MSEISRGNIFPKFNLRKAKITVIIKQLSQVDYI